RARDAAVVTGDQLVGGDAQSRQGGERRGLVPFHVPAVALDIGSKDRDQAALETRGFQGSLRNTPLNTRFGLSFLPRGKGTGGCLSHFAYVRCVLAGARSLGTNIKCVERLARRHEQAVSLG